ncbi:ROK family transcriptional regulator [Nocardioides donggukensis]|uniref:ROK family transcriptional regulator n=1 Tax=Nocardioides donggukensis TaxID=2774019 RepID=A0A927PZL9_9ACTN|nr:ROK family transcriptional regulator [Nocardioides donggukensis]MBD8870418.1 ROK family transcriptional regulator [Nocardioides donggukensis]
MTPKDTVLSGPGASADQLAVRRHNLSLVLSHLRQSGPRSRARVASETGLNKATVSSLVAELVGRGLVAEGEPERGGVGRPGQSIGLDGRHHVAIGAEINIDYVSVLAMNVQGEVAAERRVALDAAHMGSTPVLSQLATEINELTASLRAGGASPVGLTVAVPGLVESATGTVFEAPNLGWRRTSILDDLGALLHDPTYPVRLDNEANLAALAELAARGADEATDLLLLTGAVGVGGGVVTDGQLLRGGQGFAGEVGHMKVQPDGKRCGCGRHGCWETVVGLNALLARAADPEDPVRNPSLDVVQRLEEVVARATAGDARTIEAITDTGRWLATGAGILVNVFNPEVLVLGGYFAALGPWLAGPLEEELPRQVFAPEAGGCRVELSTLGFSAAVRGGALQALSSLFADPTLVDAAPTSAAAEEGAVS